jgi:hypothetical protein
VSNNAVDVNHDLIHISYHGQQAVSNIAPIVALLSHSMTNRK